MPAFSSVRERIRRELQWRRAHSIYRRNRDMTMIKPRLYAWNLILCEDRAPSEGCIVECGVWRGGMSAGLAELFGGSRLHYLFDSFEGLPPPQALDGKSAFDWQADKTSPRYYDNCSAERSFAERAMKKTGATYELVQGWFDKTIPGFKPKEPIAVLRLDGDWYESTMTCLNGLYQHVMVGGIVIVDDYYTWDGCVRAVHDFMSQNKLVDRIEQYSNGGVHYFTKRELPAAG